MCKDKTKNDLESHKTIGKKRYRSGKTQKQTIYLDKKQTKLLDNLSNKGHGSKSQIIRQALDKHLTNITTKQKNKKLEKRIQTLEKELKTLKTQKTKNKNTDINLDFSEIKSIEDIQINRDLPIKQKEKTIAKALSQIENSYHVEEDIPDIVDTVAGPRSKTRPKRIEKHLKQKYNYTKHPKNKDILIPDHKKQEIERKQEEYRHKNIQNTTNRILEKYVKDFDDEKRIFKKYIEKSLKELRIDYNQKTIEKIKKQLIKKHNYTEKGTYLTKPKETQKQQTQKK